MPSNPTSNPTGNPTGNATTKWAADTAPGEQAYTLYARIEEAFADDPILAMFVPEMRRSFANALMDRFTEPAASDPSSRTVIADIDRWVVRDEALALINTSPLSLLSGAAQDHLAKAVARGLFPHATAAATSATARG